MPISLFGRKFAWSTVGIVGLVAAGIAGTASTIYVATRDASADEDLVDLTVPVQAKNLTVRVTASGTIVPVRSVNLSPKTAGRLVELMVEQGDRVQQGQPIARMENEEILAQGKQAEAQLAQATAKLAELEAGNRPEEIERAKARLARAKAKLAELKAGTRPEDIEQAKAQVESAGARAELARQRRDRFETLYQEGAVSQDRYDEAVTEWQQARSALEEALESLQELRNGPRAEEVARAEADVYEAQQDLLELQRGPRSEDIARVRAEVAESKWRMREIEERFQDTLVRAPFSGIVTQRYADEGAFVTPTTSASATASATSTSIVAIAEGLEVLAEVPEVDIGRIKPNQQVSVVADAYPDKTFRGKVRLIAPEAIEEENVTLFQVRVALETGLDKLMSGMNVNLTFRGDRLSNAIVVPTVAVVTYQGETGVLVLDKEEQEPEFRSVTLGSTIEDQIQILEGVKPTERVFVDLPEGTDIDEFLEQENENPS
ncbi:efflux RND transporter periplasmic adaptor subunit [Geitlerinema sp. PCC 9228]|jgi:HlyD family secretion protein|uniref:efflux RND transporter periplasmic adaptor subunit n=1 Tax=Geitlerinema sp. PCC 9228 TaxID=111611 RepID=UPI000ACFECEF|nr:efflux RND transporter periplasmic adaptor subunit [Geitlerinema sp. PCC 9228]